MYTYLSDPEVVKYMGLAPFKSKKETREEFQWYEKIFSDNTGIRWGITLKGSENVIGSCGFLNIRSGFLEQGNCH